MIDVENEIFTKVATELRTQFPKVNVYGEDVRSPSSFPCVSIVEADNYTVKRTQDSGRNENHANLGFTRTMKNPVSMDDATIYRMVTRYTAIVSTNQTIYRR